MCKVLLLGSHLNYNLEHYVKINLEKLGCEVLFDGYKDKLGRLATPLRMLICRSKTLRNLSRIPTLSRINKEIRRLAESFKPELVLAIKGEAVLPETVEWLKRELGVKTALWYPDDPRYFASLVRYIAPHYDHVFTASEKAMKMYHEIEVKDVDYLPFACEPSVHRKVQISEEARRRFGSDICFVGTYYPRRARVISELRRNGFYVDIYGPYWSLFKRNGCVHHGLWGLDVVKAFNSSKIVLDIYDRRILSYEVSMRTFEATGSGAFLLTERAFGLEKLFAIGKELVCYNGDKELIELLKYYLESEEERMEISVKGQCRAYKEHTYTIRVKDLLTKIG